MRSSWAPNALNQNCNSYGDFRRANFGEELELSKLVPESSPPREVHPLSPASLRVQARGRPWEGSPMG